MTPKSREAVAQQILTSARFEAELAAVASKIGKPLSESRKEAELALRAMVSVHSPFFGFVFARGLGPLHARAWSLDVDWAALKRLQQENANKSQAPFLMAHRVLRAFLEAYFIVADRLAAHPSDAPVDEQKFLARCIAVGRQYVLQKRLRNPECVSRELFSNALALAANRGLLQPGAEDLAERRRRFAEETAAAVSAVAAIGELDYRLRHSAQDQP